MSYNPFKERSGITVNNAKFTGTVEIEGLADTYAYEIGRVKGQTGMVKPKFTGIENREFTVKITLNNAQEYETYASLRNQIPRPNPKEPNKGLSAMSIQHPLLNERGIDLVVLKKDVAEVKDETLMRWTVSLEFVEVPPAPQRTVAKVSNVPVPTQEDLAKDAPFQREIEEAEAATQTSLSALGRQEVARRTQLEEDLAWTAP
ncbi:MAG: hypothetical protein ACOYBP_08940 [Microbacteriaceae bacterium]